MDAPTALLLTDLVASAALSQQLGDAAMGAVWAVHDRAARDLLREWRGREIDKTDGFLLLFDSAADALGYVMAYHRTLAELEAGLQARHAGLRLRARAGLHVGQVTLRETPSADVALGAKPMEVDGISKPMAARVMSTALGRQTLLTQQALQAIGPTPHRVVSHGHWRIKGLPEPLELFEIGEPDAPFLPPPDGDKTYRVVQQGDLWMPVREMRHSLPAERDAFVGRGGMLRDLSQRFDQGARIVSLVGLGGCGKTRLAVRFGWVVLGDFPGGVWFCDLAPARGIDGLASAVAQGLDVPLGKDDPIVQLGQAIQGRGPCLVILDNFEHLARHAEATIGQWLGRAPQASFLVTTREVLGIPGEETIALPPLRQADAERLFLRRAAAAKRDFAPNADELAAVAKLVALLDGLPLAIELAAARVRTLSPHALLSRMSERFKLLTSHGGRMDRQSTLRAAFDWSWDLMSTAEKTALAQLSVFEGSFTLEAAEAVLDLQHLADPPWTMDVVIALVDKSFVRTLTGDRYDLLVTVQAYAAEHLANPTSHSRSGPAALRAAELRHARWYASLGPERAVQASCADMDNLVVACRRCVASSEAELAAQALRGAWAAISLCGPLNAGLELARSVCDMPGLLGPHAALAHGALAAALEACGQPEQAGACYDKALLLARKHTVNDCEAEVLTRRGTWRSGVGRSAEARDDLHAALELATRLDAALLQCSALNGLGNLEYELGRLDLARAHYLQALGLAQRQHDQGWQAKLLGNLGSLHAREGELSEALGLFERALASARESGNRQLQGNWLTNLGMLQYLQGSLQPALASLQSAADIAVQLAFARLECVVRANMAQVLLELEQAESALMQAESALALSRQQGLRGIEAQVTGQLAVIYACLGRRALAQRALDEADGQHAGVQDPETLAVWQCRRAECLWHAGLTAQARQAGEQAEAAAVPLAATHRPEIGRALERMRRCLAQATPADSAAPAR